MSSFVVFGLTSRRSGKSELLLAVAHAIGRFKSWAAMVSSVLSSRSLFFSRNQSRLSHSTLRSESSRGRRVVCAGWGVVADEAGERQIPASSESLGGSFVPWLWSGSEKEGTVVMAVSFLLRWKRCRSARMSSKLGWQNKTRAFEAGAKTPTH